MSQYNALPFLVINYGVEMIYVLHSRLVAQKVSAPKIERVMTDLAVGMLNNSFLDELFRPQELYSDGAARSLFSSLCDVSIIHLDDTSMQKLYDLIGVGVKYQIISLNHPMEMVELTLNHLDGLQRIAPTCANITGTKERLERLISSITIGDVAAIRHRLLNFSNRCRIRGSLLLEKGLQKSDGTFCIPNPPSLAPMLCNEPPGMIRNYLVNPPTQVAFSHPLSGLSYSPSIRRGEWNPFRSARFTNSGFNIYEPGTQNTKSVESPSPSPVVPAQPLQPQPVGNDSKEQLNAYQNEVAFLCKFVGGQNKAPKMDRIKLDFFECNSSTDAKTEPQKGRNNAEDQQNEVQTVRMDAAAIQKENKKLLNIIGGLGPSKKQIQRNDNDLLDLMDDI